MIRNLKLYEINTRVWLKRFGESAKLSSISDNVLDDFQSKGLNIIWLMGIWKTCPDLIDRCCYEPDLVSAYNNALKDWSRKDLIGSPYSIDCYQPEASVASEEELLVLKEKLNKRGIKLFLDFVPNHFSAETRFLKTNPEIFLQADEETFIKNNYGFFKDEVSKKIFAHGRDPFFSPWTDTVQVNDFNPATRKFMIDTLLKVSELCDGVRCDMAMLVLNNVFYNTWAGILNKTNYNKPENEFWSDAIRSIKVKRPDFIFLAEAYWDLEWNLQQTGFDYIYDKRLLDRLSVNDVAGIKAHLTAEKDYQLKLVRYIENHDEPRAVSKFGVQKSLAAAAIISTIPGMKFYHDGQFEGKKIKLPVQLGRESKEKFNLTVQNFYTKILEITKHPIFNEGDWEQLEPISAGGDNQSFQNMCSWRWTLGTEERIIVVNYSESTSQCRLKIQMRSFAPKIILIDLLTEEIYKRSPEEIKSIGLFIELKAYNMHIFTSIS